MTNDKELVNRSIAGDIDAFTDLVRRHQAMAFGYAVATIRDIHLAEDATQQAFLIAYRNLGKLRDPNRFAAWLRGIVRYESLRLRRTETQFFGKSELSEFIPDDSPGPVELIEQQDSLSRVLDALNGLPEHERIAAYLFYVQDQPQREVAAFLNLTVSTVNNRLRSARAHLRHQGALQMTTQQRDFSNRIGEVLRSTGRTIDAHLAKPDQTRLLDLVTIGEPSDGPTTAAFVSQFLDDDHVRLVTLDPGSAKFANSKGTPIHGDQGELTVSLDQSAISDICRSLRSDTHHTDILETGIKVIDLFAPLRNAGTVALVGDMNVGKLVLVEELFTRLADTTANLTVIVFLQSPDELNVVHTLEHRTSPHVEAMFLPVTDASVGTLEPVLLDVDAVLTFSSELATQQRYPAIDPVTSRSNLSQHELAIRARRILATNSAKAESIRDFLTQPFFVAEPFTGKPGDFITRNDTLNELKSILD